MTKQSTLQEPILAPPPEIEKIQKLAKVLRGSQPLVFLTTASGEKIPIPASVRQVMCHLLELMAADKAVHVEHFNHELTAREAAYLLRVPQSFVMKLLFSGEIPHHSVSPASATPTKEETSQIGSYPRIWFEDLMAYKRQRDIKRREGLREITQLSQELGLYEDGVKDKK
ncbi:MAG: hypothetical protein GDA56_33405 [Hormoscilla sp. GM7CHS1pb]|nr:hypothetical protein [Hormoscilla sp. GM7CHS1pb]